MNKTQPEINKIIKSAHLGKYLDQLGVVYGIPLAYVGDLFIAVMDDGVNRLILNKDEYEAIKRWIVCQGHWDWDKKTFIGIELEII